MRRPGLISFFLVSMLASQTATAQQKHTITPEDIVDIRYVSDANISPDGKRIAFVIVEPGDPNKPQEPRDKNIWMVPVDGREPARPIAPSAKREDTPRWSPDGKWLAFLSSRGEDKLNQIWLMRNDTGAAEKLTNAKAGVEDYRWSPDGRMIAFLTRDGMTDDEKKKQERRDDAILVDHDDKYRRLWIAGLDDRKSALVTRQNLEVWSFDWSPDDSSFAIVYTTIPGWGRDLMFNLAVVRRSDGELLNKLSDKVSYFNTDIRWSPNGKNLLFFEGSLDDKSAYWMALIDPRGGQARPILKEYPATFWSGTWTADSAHLITEAAMGTRARLLNIEVGTGKATPLTDVLKGVWADVSASADGRTLAVVSEKPDAPPDVWAQSFGQPLRRITNINPQIASLTYGSLREVTWKSHKDGQVLAGVLVTPPDFHSGRPYPTIVQPHPGNMAWWSGWQGSWCQWAQLLASNGYVVFLPNARGVTGQGWSFNESHHTFGGSAFDDTMDGVDYLVEQKIADPNRLGIAGWSNGGYMTAWAITHTDRFKAAVPGAAPTDYPLWWGIGEIGKVLEARFGDTPLHAHQKYEAISPFNFVQNCKTPALLLHGENDSVIPIAGSYEFYHALRALGVETELVIYPREGHLILERAHQIDVQRRVLEWFDKHLK